MEQSADLDASATLRAQSQDWTALWRLICRHGTRALAQGRAKAFRQWIASVPAQVAAGVRPGSPTGPAPG